MPEERVLSPAEERAAGSASARNVPPNALVLMHEWAEALSRRVPLEQFAKKFDMDVEQANRLSAELVNAVLLRRMVNLAGTKTAHVPTMGISMFAHSTFIRGDGPPVVEVQVTVTNELHVPLTRTVMECVSFTNSSMTALAFDGPIRLVAGSPQVFAPGASLEYRARYVPSEPDYADDGLVICSFIAQGYSEHGEWAIGQEDAWIELGENGTNMPGRR